MKAAHITHLCEKMKYGKYKGSSHHRILTETLTAITFKGRLRGERESGLGELVSFQPACLKVADSEVLGSNPGVERFFLELQMDGSRLLEN